MSKEQRELAQSGKMFVFGKVGRAESLDICEQVGGATLYSRDACVLTILLTLLLMKLRILNARQEWSRALDVFWETTKGKEIDMVSPIMKDLFLPANYLEAQLKTLIAAIEKTKSQHLASTNLSGAVSRRERGVYGLIAFPALSLLEAVTTLKSCDDSFRETPGARERLVRRYGERPRYHYDPFDYTAEEAGFRSDEED